MGEGKIAAHQQSCSGGEGDEPTANFVITLELIDEPTPCGAIAMSGPVKILIHTTDDGNGGFHIKGLANPRGLTGVHEDGGTIHGTGGTHFEGSNIGPGEVVNFVNNFTVIGEGDTPNFMVHEVIHTTVNANGDVTVSISLESVE